MQAIPSNPGRYIRLHGTKILIRGFIGTSFSLLVTTLLVEIPNSQASLRSRSPGSDISHKHTRNKKFMVDLNQRDIWQHFNYNKRDSSCYSNTYNSRTHGFQSEMGLCWYSGILLSNSIHHAATRYNFLSDFLIPVPWLCLNSQRWGMWILLPKYKPNQHLY